MLSLLFVDDHPLYRDGMCRALREAMPRLRVRVAQDAASALAALGESPETDLVLSDFQLPGRNGLELLKQVGAAYPQVARALLASALSAELAQRAQRIGCVACLSKDRNAAAMGEALRALFEGNTVFDAEPAAAVGPQLSQRRVEMLRLAAKGLTNRDIAECLSISESTVKDHWTYIFEQLQVANRAEAVSRALGAQLL